MLFLGAFCGSIIFPIIGSLFGFIAGGFAATYFFEMSRGLSKDEAYKIAQSTTLSYLLSKALKTTIIIIFGIYLIFSI